MYVFSMGNRNYNAVIDLETFKAVSCVMAFDTTTDLMSADCSTLIAEIDSPSTFAIRAEFATPLTEAYQMLVMCEYDGVVGVLPSGNLHFMPG